ncbi:PREDICTED: uncharacterized protein LOC104601244 isoform X2 [Nelumbo nucifera]|uniref:Uncharacterized protein LOC104601244 isoform X2 n=1 Tax=Nelumbo nucifera TaxID=4432 RepID=A0A1U8AJV2_NELNU|nr:PREDICTED: uncharacterized protein LOC104601244 isoform X2 [Nelumbo nucifera]
MEALTSSAWKIFSEKRLGRASFCSRTWFDRPELGRFLRPQEVSNVVFPLSIALQQHKPIPIQSLSTASFASEAQADWETAEYQGQATYLPRTVHVRFQLQKECLFGERFLLVGDDPIFGLWDPSNAIPLEWSDGHIWTVDLDIPIGKAIQYKFILKAITGVVVWQPGPDRVLQTWNTTNKIIVLEDWEDSELQKITEEAMADPKEGSLVNPNTEDMTDLNREVMANVNQKMVVAKNISHPSEGPMSIANKGLIVAENINYPKEGPTDHGNREVAIAESIIQSKEEAKLNTNNKWTVSESILRSHGRTINGKSPIIMNNIENLIAHEEGHVLVPGLTPLPQMATKGLLKKEIEEINNASTSVAADETKDYIAPEEDQLHEKQEPGREPLQEEATEFVFDNVTKGEVHATILQQEPCLANEHGQSNLLVKGTEEELNLTLVQEQSSSQADKREEEIHLTNEQAHKNSQSDNVEVLQNDIKWGHETLRKLLLNLGFLF